jgi:hypothetical protein
LIDNEVKVGEALVDALIQGRIRFRLKKARRDGSLGPGHEVEVLLERLCGIREPVRVDLLRALDRDDQKALAFGIGSHKTLQLKCRGPILTRRRVRRGTANAW